MNLVPRKPFPWKYGRKPEGLRTKKVLICGCRNFDQYEFLRERLDVLTFWFEDVVVVSGGNKTLVFRDNEVAYVGADYWGEQWALDNYYTRAIFEADWKNEGKKAGPLRNAEMALFLSREPKSAFCVAFQPKGRNTPGTSDMLARAAGVLHPSHIKVFRYKEKK